MLEWENDLPQQWYKTIDDYINVNYMRAIT